MIVDGAGEPLGAEGVEDDAPGSSGPPRADLFTAVDRASPERAAEQLEAQVEGAGIHAVRDARFTLAAAANRTALPSLAVMDLRDVLARVEA